MLRITAHQFLSQSGVVPLPKTSEVCGYLHRTAVWRQELEHEDAGPAQTWSLRHAEKVLHARRDAGRLSFLVPDQDGPAAGQGEAVWRKPFDVRRSWPE